MQWFKTKIARALGGTVLLVALYAIAGFLIGPKILRHELLTQIPQTLAATPTVGEIHINPFLFQVEIRDFSLAGAQSDKLLGFERLFVDFDLSSLWHRAYTFGRIELAAPYLNAVVASDGTLNLAKLASKRAAAPASAPAAKREPMPPLRVGSLEVTRAAVSYDDHSRPSEFSARLAPIDFELKDFTTGIAGGLFTFTGSSKLGERIEWHGHLSIDPIESDGELSVNGLRAHTIWEYLADRLNFAIDSGSIDVAATYKFALRDAVELSLNIANLSLTDLAVKPLDSDSDWIDVPALKVTGVAVDLAQRQAQIESVALSGVKVIAWREPDGAINLMRLAAAPAGPAAAKAQPAPTLAVDAGARDAAGTGAVSSAGAAPWRFDLHRLEVREAHISAEDRGTQPAAKVALAPLSFAVEGLSLDLAKPVKVSLDTRINGSGSLTANGEVTPDPLSASMSVKLAGIDLTAAQPYVAQHTSLTVSGGKLGGEAEVHYGPKAALQLAGNLFVENLHTVDDARHDDLVNWGRLDVRGLNYRQAPDRLEIAEVSVRKPFARVIIESDASLNVTNALADPGQVTSGAPPNVALPPNAALPPKAARTSGGPRPAGRSPVASAPASKPMPMVIKKILLEDGLAKFTDLSVKPSFAAAIQGLKGSVLGLSSQPSSRATVDLHGSVDAFSPVSITGQVNVLSPVLYTDLAMDFRNMELSIFNPYSGKFAGYNITKGKLTTELHYKVVGRSLDAQHHIIVDQLEFGGKTESKDAVSLPVKLAVALLKDRNGVIDLDFPVAGTLDDPQFKLAPIIWKVIVNILEKAVTAPFALLGSLFGGGPDLQFIDFKPGVGTLDPTQAGKVAAIVKALKERPQLKLEVPIAAVPNLDQPALADARFSAAANELASQSEAHKKLASGATAAHFDDLDPAVRLDVLTKLYSREIGGSPKYPDTLSAGKQKSELMSAKIEFLTGALRAHWTVGPDELKALGEQRSLALQQSLLTGTGIEPERVFLVANDKASEKDGAVRLELSLR
jgi:Domain of Unknown Function (DUF748)